VKIVIVGGHPGDPEYGCGGTVARYADAGHQVALLYLNRGEKTCGEEHPPRVEEARRACSILRATPVFAAQCDANAIVDAAHYDEFRKLLADQNPDAVFTQWPIDNHRDHRAAYLLTYDAWLRLGQRFALYYYEVSDGEDTLMFHPTEYVDVSGVADRKRAACYAHASQSPDRYYAMQDEVARFRGVESGVARAEAFVRHTPGPDGRLPR
jgi:LmbE family N-acetylglucosaminyl deacetylase